MKICDHCEKEMSFCLMCVSNGNINMSYFCDFHVMEYKPEILFEPEVLKEDVRVSYEDDFYGLLLNIKREPSGNFLEDMCEKDSVVNFNDDKDGMGSKYVKNQEKHIEYLKTVLESLVSKQEYAKAAKVRDEIKMEIDDFEKKQEE